MAEVIERGLVCLIAYARISDTRAGKNETTGVTTQHASNRARARRLGPQYLIVRRYTDNDLSSAKDEYRPDYESMLKDLQRGQTEDGYPVHGVICTEEDRIYRLPVQWQRFVSAFRSRPGRHFSDSAGYQDLYAEGAEVRGLVNVAISMGEIRKKKSRARLWHEGLAMRGIPHTGGRPFGYSADGRTLDPEEAPILRHGIDMCVAGAAWATITGMFQASGISTRRGGPWQVQTVKQIISNPRNAGLRVIDGEVYRDPETGEYKVGDWDTVCSVEELELVWKRYRPRIRKPNRDVLPIEGEAKEPRRRKTDGSVDKAYKYLLSGLLRCGRIDPETGAPCGGKLRGSTNTRGRKLHVYVCPPPSQGGCSGLGRSGPPIDELIERLAIAKLKERAARAVPEGEWPKKAILKEIKDKLDTLGARWVKSEITDERYFALSATLEAHLKELQAEYDAWSKARAVRRESATDIEFRWHNIMDLRQKRKTIDEMFSAIIVSPVGKGKQGNKMHAIRPVWRPEMG
ncbi:recombinase family protein [Nonomuraea roseola]|uniref:Recombinase family protein n=1 Tax=Nonomuraea roseola TaxID=46179 RepID=A0ABV5Q0P0_9ACTN